MSQLENNGSNTNSQTRNQRRHNMPYYSHLSRTEIHHDIYNYFYSQWQQQELIIQCLQALLNVEEINDQ